MKRINNIFEKIVSIENLQLADKKAQKGKANQYGVKLHLKNQESNIIQLHHTLISGKYKTSQYDVFTIYEPKERLVYRLPYYPDRITHHAVMNILEPIFVETFTKDTYSCIKGRGIHKLFYTLKEDLKDQANTTYCLKFDIKKFYPSINHDVLKSMLRKKIKDARLLQLLDEIIDSAPGLPIGNYLSQYLANFYLSYFDHWIKEEMKVKYYYRYADDIVILNSCKQTLHDLLIKIKQYLRNIKLEVKENHQVFPVTSRGIDYVGYKFYHTHTLIRKSIKKSFARKIASNPNHTSKASYLGWLKHCNGKHLTKTILKDEKL
ncbi:MAG: reverse transcriptase/maturase family protein [Cyclobacteriaceae bacterium]|jgi:RNA-directed DNA polymerase|nr:reverse transcriptase/maturase family protein [Cytophagales bacterium]MCZ8326459.1 reverse transcriptase/maturase family protein [Cyclobacteriaceae bacterium]